jgi:hypothetical protein
MNAYANSGAIQRPCRFTFSIFVALPVDEPLSTQATRRGAGNSGRASWFDRYMHISQHDDTRHRVIDGLQRNISEMCMAQRMNVHADDSRIQWPSHVTLCIVAHLLPPPLPFQCNEYMALRVEEGPSIPAACHGAYNPDRVTTWFDTHEYISQLGVVGTRCRVINRLQHIHGIEKQQRGG